jgi:hypothetical protein
MFDLNQLTGILNQYTGASANNPPQNVHADFDAASRNVAPDALADGISHALRSQQTPPFHQMVSQLYESGNGEQKAGLLGKLLSAIGPFRVSGAGGMLSGLSNLLGSAQGYITPAQANRVSPEAIRELASQAEQRNPSVVEQVSGFFAQHPGWIKTLGGGALALALGRMAQRQHA